MLFRSQPDSSKNIYSHALNFKETTHLKAIAYNAALHYSYVMEADYFKIHQDRKIDLHSQYSSQYTGGGDNALIDQIRGGNNFRLGEWQGFDSVDFEAVVDLGSVQKVHRMAGGFLQDISSWIWMPKYVEYAISADGINFKTIATVTNTVADNDYKSTIKDYETTMNVETRYVRVKAKNFGTIPSWHLGAGYPSWIFIDEITIE